MIFSERLAFGGKWMVKAGFLLIREIGAGMWNEIHHVLTQLLAAEIMQRIPVVHWGEGSLYASSHGSNAFEQFFMPVSNFNVQDLAESDADVCVRDTYMDIGMVIPLMPEGHPLYGMKRRELFNRLMHRYIRLRKETQAFIDEFYDANMRDAAFLGVHIRSSDKIVEVKHLNELNSRYAAEIDKVLNVNPGMKLFLMTDSIEILEEYKQSYGELLVHTDCRRTWKDGLGVHFQEYPDNRLKGLEIIRDTWLAARCDYFIGNGYSNVSAAVSELKDWKDDRIKLLY